MKKKILIAVFITIFLILAWLGIKTFQPKTGINLAIKEIADDHLIDMVGITEFNNYYYIDSKNPSDCKDIIPTDGCYITYNFIPAKIYGGSVYLFYFSSDSKTVELANNSAFNITELRER